MSGALYQARHLRALVDKPPAGVCGEGSAHRVPTRGAGLLAGLVLVAVLLLIASVAGWAR